MLSMVILRPQTASDYRFFARGICLPYQEALLWDPFAANLLLACYSADWFLSLGRKRFSNGVNTRLCTVLFSKIFGDT